MSHRVFTTDFFKKRFKKLFRKYPKIFEDYPFLVTGSWYRGGAQGSPNLFYYKGNAQDIALYQNKKVAW